MSGSIPDLDWYTGVSERKALQSLHASVRERRTSPANEFWSLTMYDPAHNLVDKPINRYAIRDRTPGIKQEADGSTILCLQSTSPGAHKESNWLPTPKQGAFSLALCTYGPGEGIVRQTWQPPTVKKVP